MLKIIGAILIFGSSAALGLAARQTISKRVAAADAMLLALMLIRNEISYMKETMPEIMRTLAANENQIVAKVFTSLTREIELRKELSFSYLWRKNLQEMQAEIGLGAPECEILCQAANFLGRYNAEEQIEALKNIEQKLKISREVAAEELKSKGNLYRTSGLAVGILVILVLI